MSKININRKVEDPFYRYKMPKLFAKVEGRGNGIKTLIQNMSDIAKSLGVPPEYPTKYLGIELGAQVIVDSKNDRYIVNGSHDALKLQIILYEFIEKYILCPECSNPETYMICLAKKSKIEIVCQACGHRFILSHFHRLNTFIMKNPPKNIPKEEMTQKEEIMEPDVKMDKSENTQWITDISPDAVQQRMAMLTERAAEFTLNSDLEKNIKERLNMFIKFAQNIIGNNTENDIKSIVHEAKRLDIEEKAIVGIADLIFIDSQIPTYIVDYKDLLLELSKSEKAQQNLLGSIELIVSKFPEVVPTKLMQAFKILYQLEIVDENVFLAWSNKKSNRFLRDSTLTEKVHRAIEPFINWLKTAEEESDEDSNENEIVFDDQLSKPTNSPVDSVSRHRLVVEKCDDEINIDEI
ncbi:hypothetical protein HZS_3289 [Henneguya salminicola]|uniref:Eukaryotic translation initiation factor 5 n=1 Tax=Henneguya salminicola TaxID=69463 RepID=A0A6G3MEP6_HENSL|nr:hypothetical protein HZS_3289 [Henneguya salminicola]